MKTAITIFMALTVLASSCRFIEEKGWFGKSDTEDEELAVLQARQDSIRVADSIQAEKEKMMAAEKARVDSIRAAEQAQREWQERFKYHIIVGSFLTPEYADDFRDYYQSMGYDAKIIEGPQNRFNLVSAEVHDKLNEAVKRLVQYQDTVNFEAWIYIND